MLNDGAMEFVRDKTFRQHGCGLREPVAGCNYEVCYIIFLFYRASM